MTRFAAPIAEQIWDMKYRFKAADGTPHDVTVEDSWRRIARDLARIGQLVLNRGRWNDTQIVPESWLAASHRPLAHTSWGASYGYQWWLGKMRDGSGRWLAGFGNGGQRLIVIPHLDLSVVVTAGNYNQPEAWRLAVQLMAEHVMPALR